MKTLVLFIMAMLLQFSALAQNKWTVDNAHTKVKFKVTHLLISEVEGSFKVFSGTIVTKNPDFTDADISFKVDAGSINTDNEMRDNHLKSPDFFNVKEYPEMSFKSTSFKKVSGNKYILKGDLTIHGVTKPVSFDVVYGGSIKDNMGNMKVGFKASTVVDRFDYGLKWNNLTETGGAVVGKDVTIELNLEFGQVKEGTNK